MTEERKQELTQLLNEAMEGLEIGVPLGVSSLLLPPTRGGKNRTIEAYFGGGSLPLPKVKLKNYLQQRWRSYGVDSSSILIHIECYTASETTKSKLLDFMREESDPFIHEDKTDSTFFQSYAIADDNGKGFHLYEISGGSVHLRYILEHLLKIAVAWGVERAVSTFDEGSCLKGKQGFYQDIASLEGIVVEREIQVCDGVRLVPFPRPTTFEFESYFPGFSIRDSRFSREVNVGKTLLIIDRPLLSIFHKSSHETFDETLVSDRPFLQIETHDIKFPNSHKVNSFRKLFCQALSLACNSPVQIACKWWFLPEDDLLDPFPSGGIGYSLGLFGRSVKAEQSEIDKAKCLYHNLINLDSKTQGKLQIAIDRWIKSKTYQTPEDKILDLAIAFEALYVPDYSEVTFKLGVRASRYLEEHRKDREELLAVFREFYKFRSRVVHGGKPKENVTIQNESIPISKFITIIQDRCRDSIEKIMKQCLKEGKFPDNDYWDSLVLG